MEPEGFTNKHGKFIDLNTNVVPGAITVGTSESSSGNIQIFVHPQAGTIVTLLMAKATAKSSDKKPLVSTNAMVDAHEFGHASDHMGRSGPRAVGAGPRVKGPRWQAFENAVRSRIGSQRRIVH